MKHISLITAEILADLRERQHTREELVMRVISVANQKGGVGKTTTAFCLTAGLTEAGKKALCIDLEGQRNLTATLGNAQEETPTILEVLTGEADITEAILTTPAGDFIRGDKRLSLIDNTLRGADKYEKLREAIKPLHRKYDYVFIDTPPALGTLTLNALTASDYVIVPAVADLYSSYGIADLAETIEAIKGSTNKKLKTLGILLTMHNPRARLSKEMEDYLDNITKAFKTSLFDTKIRSSIKAREVQLRPEGLFKYAPKAPITEDYRALFAEVIKKAK